MNDETRRKFLIRSIGSLGVTIPIIYYGCDTGGTSGGPLGPSGAGVFNPTATITVTPPSVTLIKGAAQTFTATGGTGTSYTWSLSNTALGNIGVSTGVFTAGATAGTLTVNATDTDGASGSGAVTIVSSTITVTPATITIPNTVTLPFTQTFTASGGTTPYTYNISATADATLVAAMGLSTGVLSVTVAPTADETLTITATDAFGDTSTALVTIEA